MDGQLDYEEPVVEELGPYAKKGEVIVYEKPDFTPDVAFKAPMPNLVVDPADGYLYIDFAELAREHPRLAINSGCGSGKTWLFVRFVEKLPLSVRVIVVIPRRALGLQMKSDFPPDFLLYMDDEGKVRKAEEIQRANRLIICVESLHLLVSEGEIANLSNAIVFFDEIHTSLASLNGETVKKKEDKAKINNIFKGAQILLRDSKWAIVADGQITALDVNVLNEIRSGWFVVFNKAKPPMWKPVNPPEGSIVIKHLKQVGDIDKESKASVVELIVDMIDVKHEKPYVHYSFLSGARHLVRRLCPGPLTDDDKFDVNALFIHERDVEEDWVEMSYVLLLTGESSREVREVALDLLNNLGNPCVCCFICTNACGPGLSFDPKQADFDRGLTPIDTTIGVIGAGCESVEEAVQCLLRVRHPASHQILLFFEKPRHFTKMKLVDIEDSIRTVSKAVHAIYEAKGIGHAEDMRWVSINAAYQEYTRNIGNADVEGSILWLLGTRAGYKVIESENRETEAKESKSKDEREYKLTDEDIPLLSDAEYIELTKRVIGRKLTQPDKRAITKSRFVKIFCGTKITEIYDPDMRATWFQAGDLYLTHKDEVDKMFSRQIKGLDNFFPLINKINSYRFGSTEERLIERRMMPAHLDRRTPLEYAPLILAKALKVDSLWKITTLTVSKSRILEILADPDVKGLVAYYKKVVDKRVAKDETVLCHLLEEMGVSQEWKRGRSGDKEHKEKDYSRMLTLTIRPEWILIKDTSYE